MPPIPVIAGPTAVGKTSTALELGRLLGFPEIVSCDSRQIYRGMDIGTAKPPANVLQEIPHHFVDELDVGQSFSAGEFQLQAESRMADIQARDHAPVVVGGSTLYLRALVLGLGQTPRVDADLRTRLNRRMDAEGPEVLYNELAAADPAYAATLDTSKTQRIVRGLEVFAATGRTLTSFQQDHSAPRHDYIVFVLSQRRERLYAEINDRVDDMMQRGLAQEVERFHDAGFSEHTAAMRTIGYQELFPALRGEYAMERAVELVKRNSRRYAKRQLTWYRGMKRAHWIDVDGLSARDVAEQIHSVLGS